MKQLVQFICISIVVGFSSCQKVIELDLKETDIKYVVEGTITNEAGSCKVLLSESKPFYQNNQFTGISNAIIKIEDNGSEFQLSETQPGIYQNILVTGTPGHRYELSIMINGQQFTAVSTMPQPVAMDTLYISAGPFNQFSFATVGYSDPPGTKNYYRFVQYLNDIKDPEIFWENDEFTNGLEMITQLDTGVDEKDDPRNIKAGDKVRVEMLSIDENVYRYWSSLSASGGDGSSDVAAPANPLTNITGGALGYFSAQGVVRRTVIAP